MFKSLNLLIHKTPWWAMLLGGAVTLALLVLFAAPIQVIRLPERAVTAEEKRAIQHEIGQAFKDGGLSLAERVVSTMKERAKDPDRRRELERALAEIERARNHVSSVQDEAAQAARDAAQEALESAREAAEGALDSAREAREAIEESRDEVLQKLRDKGLDVAATAQSFDDLLKGARQKEAAAQAALDEVAKSRERMQRETPPNPDPQIHIQMAPGGAAGPGIHIGVPAVPGAPLPPLPPELRNSIRATVLGDMWRVGVGSALILAFIPLFVMLLIAKFFIGRSRRALDFAQRKGEEAQLSDMRRQMTEARLQALQAQVEPHFLYNTLANVQALTEVDPPAANRLVGHLIEYLRAALPKMRESSSTVGQEVERVRAYLNILKIRMGERLDFGIEVDPDLLSLPFPPMMLPSLVENAIKHGLEPLREGGRIDVLATRELHDGVPRLRLQVRDTGAGLAQQASASGGGLGLSNLRERLQALYGEQGIFTLQANEPRGAVAVIDVPVAAVLQTVAAPGVAGAAAQQAPVPQRGWRRFWGVTRRTHGAWTTLLSRLFMLLMLVLLVAFFAGLAGLFTGWLPVQVNDFQIDGIEGMALGSLALLIGFGAVALVIALCLVLLYGIGFLFAGLLLLIPAVILIALIPGLSPFLLVALVIYAIWRKKRRSGENARSNQAF